MKYVVCQLVISAFEKSKQGKKVDGGWGRVTALNKAGVRCHWEGDF